MKRLLRKCSGMFNKLRKSHILNRICYCFQKWLIHNYLTINTENARQELQAVSPKPSGSPFTRNKFTLSPEYDLQIIVPAYNAEPYLNQCMDSILKQNTKYQIQIIVINDGSCDRTGEIADSFTDSRIRVIHQENSGAAAARNTALKHLNAKYIMFVDADDWLIEGSIDALMDMALEKDAEIVQAGYYYQTGVKIYPGLLYPRVTQVDDPAQLYGFPVGKVYKSSLWTMLQFPEGFWFEDTVLSFLLFPRITNAWLIPESVYVYRQNVHGSTYTARAKPKSLDAYWVTEMLLEARNELGLKCNAQFQRKFFGQILLNAQRITYLSDDVKQKVFILTCQLYKVYFSDIEPDPQFKDLEKALRKQDYGLFTLYTKYYRVLFLNS